MTEGKENGECLSGRVSRSDELQTVAARLRSVHCITVDGVCRLTVDGEPLEDLIEEAADLIESIQWWEGVYDGKPLTKAEIAAELHDYRMILPEVAKVFVAASGGKISKQNTHAHEVIACMDDMINLQIEMAVEEALEEAAEFVQALGDSPGTCGSTSWQLKLNEIAKGIRALTKAEGNAPEVAGPSTEREI